MLGELAEDCNAGLLMLTESHLTNEVRDAEITIEGFEIHRTDRVGFRNGGVLIYARSTLSLGLRVVLSFSQNKVDVLILESKKINMIIACVYRPPDTSYENFNQALMKVEQVIEEHGGPNRTLLVAGDFNLPIIDWREGQIFGGTRDQQEQAKILVEFADKYFMEQLIQEATRNMNILDLFLTNNDDMVIRVEVEPKSILSDHKLQIITTRLIQTEMMSDEIDENDTLHHLNFFDNKIQWQVINDKLNIIDWTQLLAGLHPAEAYKEILKEIKAVCLEFIPKKRIKQKSIIPNDRKLLMKKRSNLKKKYQKCYGDRRYKLQSEIEMIEEKLKISHKMEAEKKEDEAIAKIKENPKYFYHYARQKSLLKTTVGPFIEDDEMMVEPVEKANGLQEQYLSVYGPVGYEILIVDEINSIPGPRSKEAIIVSPEEIKKAINTISTSSASGPDGVPAVLIKNCKEALCKPLVILWQESLDGGVVPEDLKAGCIVPIHKGGDKCSPKNYRPITLTSHIVKIIEKLIVKELVDYMSEANLFKSRQHGFRQKRSCLSQLLEHYQLKI